MMSPTLTPATYPLAPCQKCRRHATTRVRLDFIPGGTQEFRLCDDHTGELYSAIARWFSGDAGRVVEPQPGYLKGEVEAKPDPIAATPVSAAYRSREPAHR